MKKYRRMTAVLMMVLLVTAFLPVQAAAAGKIDPEREESLRISYQKEDGSLVGAQFAVYLVATVDAYGELTTTDTFSRFNVDIRGKNDDAWQSLSAALEGYVLRDNVLHTDSGQTDEEGILTFPTAQQKLIPGLYLVLGQRHIQDGYYYDAASFLVMLPGLDKEANDWIYDVTAEPKYESGRIPEEPVSRKVLKVWKDEGHSQERPDEVVVQLLRDGTVYDTVTLNDDNNWRYTWKALDGSHRWTVAEKELEGYTVTVEQERTTFVVTNTYKEKTTGTTTTTKSTLPQTGQMWWPVPLLITLGLLFVIVGLIRRRGTRDER